MAGQESSQTVRLTLHMQDAVDGAILKEAVEATRQRYPYHQVTHWNDIYLDRIDDELTKQWIRQSYELVLSKLPRKFREKYI